MHQNKVDAGHSSLQTTELRVFITRLKPDFTQSGWVCVGGWINEPTNRKFTLLAIYNAALTLGVGWHSGSFPVLRPRETQNHKAAFMGPRTNIFSIASKWGSCKSDIPEKSLASSWPPGISHWLLFSPNSTAQTSEVAGYKHRVGSFLRSIWSFDQLICMDWRRIRMQTKLEHQVSEWALSVLCWQEAHSRKPGWFSIPFK